MSFSSEVISKIKQIPKGRVASYGQVASASGKPRSARQVGQILKNLDPSVKLPWWRVINSKGEISIKGNWTAEKSLQKKLLEKDGVVVSKNYKLDIELYRHKF